MDVWGIVSVDQRSLLPTDQQECLDSLVCIGNSKALWNKCQSLTEFSQAEHLEDCKLC